MKNINIDGKTSSFFSYNYNNLIDELKDKEYYLNFLDNIVKSNNYAKLEDYLDKYFLYIKDLIWTSKKVIFNYYDKDIKMLTTKLPNTYYDQINIFPDIFIDNNYIFDIDDEKSKEIILSIIKFSILDLNSETIPLSNSFITDKWNNGKRMFLLDEKDNMLIDFSLTNGMIIDHRDLKEIQSQNSSFSNLHYSPNYLTVKINNSEEESLYTFNDLFDEIRDNKYFEKEIIGKSDKKKVLKKLEFYLDTYFQYISDIIDEANYFYVLTNYDEEYHFYTENFKRSNYQGILSTTNHIIEKNAELFILKTKEEKELFKNHFKFCIGSAYREPIAIDVQRHYLANDEHMPFNEGIDFLNDKEYLIHFSRSDGYIYDYRDTNTIMEHKEKYRKINRKKDH